jgi:hypothetical protein
MTLIKFETKMVGPIYIAREHIVAIASNDKEGLVNIHVHDDYFIVQGTVQEAFEACKRGM